MCLIAFALQPRPGLHLVLAANRDEFHGRPATSLGVWPDEPQIIGGRDSEAHGTWLGVSTRGRLAAVTNVRLPSLPAGGQRSRGALPLDFLVAEHGADEHLRLLQASFAEYGPCNLLMIEGDAAIYASNRPGVAPQRLRQGLWGLSNAALDTPWPKTRRLKAVLADWLAADAVYDLEPLFAALADDRRPTDAELPDTGVGLEMERMVAPAFIRGARYGTRCSTMVTVTSEGAGLIVERRFGPDGIALGETRKTFQWPAQASPG